VQNVRPFIKYELDIVFIGVVQISVASPICDYSRTKNIIYQREDANYRHLLVLVYGHRAKENWR
jgi:hypothetical protein